MSIVSRRDFLRTGLAASAALALGSQFTRAAEGRPWFEISLANGL